MLFIWHYKCVKVFFLLYHMLTCKVYVKFWKILYLFQCIHLTNFTNISYPSRRIGCQIEYFNKNGAISFFEKLIFDNLTRKHSVCGWINSILRIHNEWILTFEATECKSVTYGFLKRSWTINPCGFTDALKMVNSLFLLCDIHDIEYHFIKLMFRENE